MKHHYKLHGPEREDKIVTREFLKKYVSYAKRTHPVLTPVAKEYIVEQWNLLRRYYEKHDCNMPVTVRQLETLIRLATAKAKLRLDQEVSEEDAVEAFRLLWISVFNKEPSHETLHAGGDGVAPEMEALKKKPKRVPASQKEQKENLTANKPKKEKKGREVNSFLKEEGYDFSDEDEPASSTSKPKRASTRRSVKRETAKEQIGSVVPDPITEEA